MLHTCLCLSLKMVYRSFRVEGILWVWAEQHLQILPIMHIIHQKLFSYCHLFDHCNNPNEYFFFLHKTHRMLKSILNNTCELVQLLNAWAIPKSAIPLQILKISKQMLILLKKFIIIFTLMLLVYEIRKSNAVIEGQSNVFFLYLVGQFREKNKRVELILTQNEWKLKFTLIDLKSVKSLSHA